MEPAVPGPSGANKRSRNKERSSSSSSSCKSSCSEASSSDSNKKQRRSRRKKQRRGKRHSSSTQMIKDLAKELSDLRKQLLPNNQSAQPHLDEISLSSEVSGELYDQNNDTIADCTSNNTGDFNLNIETKLKESAVPKTCDHYLRILNEIQRFNSEEWSEIRYSDTQKQYNHTPGFVELEANYEIKAYDTLRHLIYADKSYAGLTYCVLKQREVLQEKLRDFLSWAKTSEGSLNFDNISDKMTDIFVNGEYSKVSADLLQLVCGHRAETVEMRRDAIINSVKDPLVKTAIRKVPPSVKHLFEADKLSATLEKAGGVKKAFWAAGKINTSASQARRPAHRPPQGSQKYPYQPSQGISPSQYGPSQGTFNVQNPPSQGGHTITNRQYPSPAYDRNYPQRGSFRSRGSKQGNQRSQRGGRNHKQAKSGFQGTNHRKY